MFASPESTFGALGFVTFIDVSASPVRARGESRRAMALEAADDVVAGAVTADAGFFGAFVGIHAEFTRGIQSIAHRTLAAERSVRVHTPVDEIGESFKDKRCEQRRGMTYKSTR